ncbi:MAG: Gfo/Idh/MocA family oxidoreductase [Gemmatimonadetes bacterium]|jgi:predicted dehydrogenase|nr:Gfo/Idh/MocA family oxidoreductase [Gemmatimonadota bacterium]MBT6147630.1 Gfo/Idh/MocA family oxidoreductase [Gemmatimonadota bacterium]MBT7862329.1 Gfo/Idh/MocA family oxidoreductase [Gemmatimonadota bacterium]
MTEEHHDLIRVGLIRCDTHGAYYGSLMAAHDALRLQRPLEEGQAGRYSWQTGGAHYYFYTDYADASRMTVDAVDGFRLCKVWDEHADAAQCLAAVFTEPPQVCACVEDVSDDVDLVFIADCNGDGSDHLRLARPGLEKGVATFVDKPLAYSVEDAHQIIGLATQHQVPLASASILDALPDAARFARRLDEVGDLQFGCVQGGGPSLAGQIHTISLAQRIFGDGVVRVRAMGDGGPNTIHLEYGDRNDRPARGVTLNCDVGPVWHCAFHASAFGPAGAIHSPPMGDFDFPSGAAEILRQIQSMIHTGRTPATSGRMIEAVAVAEASRRAQATGQTIEVAR